jgi:2-hydroxy-3-keto-5-methylthiopentenyl-1-phosphate phosphatase
MPLVTQETKIVVFSDFDGTITWDDSNGKPLKAHINEDYMTDNLGFGVEKRKALNVAVLDHSRTFRYYKNSTLMQGYL